jgi:ABC-2 type transport system permease protein
LPRGVQGTAADRIRAITGLRLRQLGRDRVGLFFTFALPFLVIVFLGASGAGSSVPVGLVAPANPDPFTAALVQQVRDQAGLTVRDIDDRETLAKAVSRGSLVGGVVIPDDYGSTLAAGGDASVQVLIDPASGDGTVIRALVTDAVSSQSALVAAARVVSGTGAEDLAAAARAAAGTALVTVSATTVGTGVLGSMTVREYAVVGQLVMFIFLIALTAAGDLAESRRLGMSRRMLSTPTSATTIVTGEGVGRFAVSAVQAFVIIVGSTLIFGVRWGNLVAMLTVVFAFILVAVGAALLVGARARSAQQAAVLGPTIGIALGFVGGCNWPLEIVPRPMQVLALATPHGWAMTALTEIVGEGAGLADVLPQVGVLLAVAAVLLPLSARSFRQSITR